MYSYADLMTMSSKKTAMVNIGGLIACHDEDLYRKLLEELIFYEGFYSYGGLAGRDLEALAVGLYEGIDDNVLDDRVRQVAYFGQKLLDAGLPVHRPFGGHGVYLDALKLMPHIPGEQFPGETFLTLAYLEGGLRGICFGRLAFGGRFDEEGKPIIPDFETIRYAIPRRMYTYRHIDAAADSIIKAYKKRESARGLKIIYETKVLKHFLARFEPL
jgi:tryptophanase